MEIARQPGLFDSEMVQPDLFGATKRRVLIEGGFQDDWGRLHSVHPTELVLGDDVTRIDFRDTGRSYIKGLTLVYNWVDQYLIPVNPLEAREVIHNIFDYDGLQAVSSIIIGDGRVFFDRSLLKDRSENNRTRLERYLSVLREKNQGMNPINLFFTPEGRERIRFHGEKGNIHDLSPIEIYDIGR